MKLYPEGSFSTMHSVHRILASLILATLPSGCLLWIQPNPEPATRRVVVHTISVPGETLSIISQWYTGNPANWREITRATPGIDAQRLRIGQEVNIPVELVSNRTVMPRNYVKRFASARAGQTSTNHAQAVYDSETVENDRNPGLDHDLYQAIVASDDGKVTELLESGADANSGEEGRPLLGWAASQGSDKIVQALLDHGALPDAVDTRGFSALMNAVHSDQLTAAQRLLSAGANPQALSYDGRPVISIAVERNNVRMVELLIDKGAKITGPVGQIYPLLLAIQNDSAEMVRTLLAGGADVNYSQGNYTPLSYAVARQNLPIIQELLAAGADINLGPENGDPPLIVSISGGALLKTFLSAGADPNVRSSRGETPLGAAIEQGDRAVILQLLRAGASTNLATASGQLPAALADSLGRPDLAALIRNRQ